MSSQRASAGEVAACALAMALLAGLMCARHISRGGFYYDDWSLLALARFPAPGGVLHGLWLDYGQRPGQVLYYAALAQAEWDTFVSVVTDWDRDRYLRSV